MFIEALENNQNQAQLQQTFVLISCDKNMVYNVTEELLEIPIVEDVKQLQGMYDIILVLKSISVEKIKQTIANKIRLIDGVRSSLTLFEVSSNSPN